MFIHNLVITGIQWMVRWRVLVHRGLKFSVFTLVRVISVHPVHLISVHITNYKTTCCVLIEDGFAFQTTVPKSSHWLMSWLGGDINVTNKNKQKQNKPFSLIYGEIIYLSALFQAHPPPHFPLLTSCCNKHGV
jgi:hypothetical protein